MSESSTKRSRKSKLEPRKYVDIDDYENTTDLQQKPSTSKRKKKREKNVPKKTQSQETVQASDDFEALIDSQKTGADQKTEAEQKTDAEQKTGSAVPPSPLKFSVTVAVEEFDESDSELMIIEPEDNTIEILSDSDTEKDNNTRMKSKNETAHTKDMVNDELETLVLDREDILNATNKILEESTDISDKILGIDVKNCLGQFPINDEQDSKLTKVFIQWEAWQKLINQVKYRSSPLFYKCYICELSWWYLHDFREHLKYHDDDYNLDLEEYTIFEANVIAYSKVEEILDIKHFYTEGDCPKCGNEFAIHKTTNRSKNSLYSCKVRSCYKLFYTCFALRSHEYMYHTISELTGIAFQVGRQGKNCEVCGFVFHSQESYQTHMDLMHSVRSDVVVPAKYRKCNRCKAVYGWDHHCKNSITKVHTPVPCRFCYRSFLQAQAYRNHMNQIGRYQCKVCNIMLTRQCIEAEHFLKHSDKFTVVKKCGVCEDFNVFMNDDAALKHIYKHYQCTEETFTKYCRNILIPKSCLTQKMELQQSVFIEVEVNEMIPEIEPKEKTPPVELGIKQEAEETVENQSDEEFESQLQIKEEIDIEENFNAEYLKKEYSRKLEEDAEMHARIFGVKIEASDIEVKQELVEEEYEDDIIKLDYNFLENMQQSMNSTTAYVEGNEVEMQGSDDNTQEDEIDMDDETDGDSEFYLEERKKNGKQPKIYRCHKCGFDAVHKEYRAHVKSHCKERLYELEKYPCTKCSMNFDTFEKFIDHFNEHNLNNMACPECYKIFESYEALQVHLSSHIRTTYAVLQSSPALTNTQYHYMCKICQDTVAKDEFFVHWEKHLSFLEIEKAIEKNVERSEPINTEMLEQLLERLQSPHSSFKMRRGCPICLRHFDRKNDYKRHLVEHLLNHAYTQHSIHAGLKCQICVKCFEKPDHYKKHMRDHGCLKDYRCDICDKNFSDSSNYTKHKKLHNANAFTCDICRKKFQIKISLEKHMAVHENQKPIECAPCNKTFILESSYKKHYRMYHDKDKRKFACMLCRNKFHSLKEKWDHLWYVHKERKHKADCPKCDSSYRRFRDLKNHMREVHNTELRCLPPAKQTKKNTKDIIKKKMATTVRLPTTAAKKETLIVYV